MPGRKTFTVTAESGTVWEGNKGPNPFKPRGHYIMVVAFILGFLAIIAVGIWIGIDKQKQESSDEDVPLAPTTTPAPEMTDDMILQRLRKTLATPDNAYMSNFSNFDQTTQLSKLFVVNPSNPEEIQQVILAAKELDLRVRAVGAGYSYSNLFPDEGQIILRTRLLNTREDGQPYHYNPDTLTLSVAAGLTMGELRGYLMENDIQLMSVPTAMEISVGGAISTASHGRSPRDGTLSDQVVGVRYVDGDGMLQAVNSTSPAGELRRIRCCVGMCGIIYDITFKVQPLQMVKIVQGFESGQTMIRNASYLDEVLFGYHGLELYYAPLSSLTDADWDSYRTTGHLPDSYDPWQDEWWYRITQLAPNATQSGRKRRSVDDDVSPLLTGLSINGSSNATTSTPAMEYTELFSHKYAYDYTLGMVTSEPEIVRPFPEDANRYSAETLQITNSVSLIIPVPQGTNQAVRALEIAFGVLRNYTSRAQSKLPILTFELRWVKASPECVLCPGWNVNASHVLTFEMIGASYKPNYVEYATEVLRQFRAEWPETRLHWAKFYEEIPDVADFIHDSRSRALDVMTSEDGGEHSVKLWDIFYSDLLTGVVQD